MLCSKLYLLAKNREKCTNVSRKSHNLRVLSHVNKPFYSSVSFTLSSPLGQKAVISSGYPLCQMGV